ncbi:hypothetical protein FACS189450_03030 [Spirochaetia bacterium]|nr:hypothetical protein FACS189450_03030 [Spirochaetia bacterium]
MIEIKAVIRLADEFKAQVMKYLAATTLKLGFLVNFCGFSKAEIIMRVMTGYARRLTVVALLWTGPNPPNGA